MKVRNFSSPIVVLMALVSLMLLSIYRRLNTTPSSSHDLTVSLTSDGITLPFKYSTSSRISTSIRSLRTSRYCSGSKIIPFSYFSLITLDAVNIAIILYPHSLFVNRVSMNLRDDSSAIMTMFT